MSQELIDEFRSKLDEALILAISSEYDLNNKESLDSVRGVLASLAQDAEVEELSGFTPDGLGAGLKNPSDDNLTDLKSSHETTQTKDNSGARGSSTSSGTSYCSDEGCVPRIDSFDNSTDEAKNKLLTSMFPSLKQFQVDAAMKQAKGDFQAALDNLLTRQFLQSTEAGTNAIDAFFRPEDEEDPSASARKKGKKKRKGKKKGCPADQDHEIESEATSVNNILFIAERLDLPFDSVAQAYHNNGQSQGKTVAAVLDPFIYEGVEAQGDAASRRVKDLSRRYKKVPAAYLSAIVQIADTIPQWTDDIAALLEKHFSEATKGPLTVSYSLKPIEDEIEDGSNAAGAKNGKGKESARAVDVSYSGALNGVSSTVLQRQAATYEQARLSASASAADVIRRGRSNPLYRQAAVVYTERARESAQRAQAANSEAARRVVAERRTADCIDLHGLTVSDGVSVAVGEVRLWYEGLGEYRAREARKGFTVVTGVGKHSAGGVSRMRQGVCAALVNAGWKVEVGTGKFVVTGRR